MVGIVGFIYVVGVVHEGGGGALIRKMGYWERD